MSNNIAVKVTNIKKSFRLPHNKQNSVKGLFVSAFRSKTSYEKQEVLRGLSFQVHEGEFFGIVGRNGGGKSTLLKLLAGIYVPDSGDIIIEGKLAPFIELGVGFNPELTGRENVFLNGALLGFSDAEVTQMYDDIVEFAELEQFMDQKLSNYSSGMQVRLAFSVAIQSKASILLIDEVLAVGDANFQRKCFDIFEQFKKEGRTVIFISHSMDMVNRFCDRAILLNAGKVLSEGDPYMVTSQYNLINDNSSVDGLQKLAIKDSREADIMGIIAKYLSPKESIVCFGTHANRDIKLLKSYGYTIDTFQNIREYIKHDNKKNYTALIILDSVSKPTTPSNMEAIINELDSGVLTSVRRVFVHTPFYLYDNHKKSVDYNSDDSANDNKISQITLLMENEQYEMISSGLGGVRPGCQYVNLLFDKFDDEKKALLWEYLEKENQK